MKAQIYINRHIVRANKKATNETGELVDSPAIAIRTYLGSVYANRIEFTTGCKLIQDAANARCSGATIWIECDDFHSLIIDGIKETRAIFEEKKLMSAITRFPADEEIEEAASAAIDYLLKAEILREENVDLKIKIAEAIESYFLPLADESVAGSIHPNHLLVIDNQRYWLTEQEMKEVEKIKQDYPNVWEQQVLQRMKTLSL